MNQYILLHISDLSMNKSGVDLLRPNNEITTALVTVALTGDLYLGWIRESQWEKGAASSLASVHSPRENCMTRVNTAGTAESKITKRRPIVPAVDLVAC